MLFIIGQILHTTCRWRLVFQKILHQACSTEIPSQNIFTLPYAASRRVGVVSKYSTLEKKCVSSLVITPTKGPPGWHAHHLIHWRPVPIAKGMLSVLYMTIYKKPNHSSRSPAEPTWTSVDSSDTPPHNSWCRRCSGCGPSSADTSWCTDTRGLAVSSATPPTPPWGSGSGKLKWDESRI